MLTMTRNTTAIDALSGKLSLFKKYFYEICFFSLAMAVLFLFKELSAANEKTQENNTKQVEVLTTALNSNTEALKSNAALMYEVKELLKNERQQKYLTPFLNRKK